MTTSILLDTMRYAKSFLRSYWTAAGRLALTNLVLLGVCHVASLASQLVATRILSQTFGKDGFGQFLYFASFFPFLFVVMSFAGGAIALRDIKQHPDRLRQSLGTALAATLIYGGIILAIGVLVFAALPLGKVERFYLAGVLAAALAASFSNSYAFDALHRPWMAAVPVVLVDLAYAAALYYFHTEDLLSPGVLALAFAGRQAGIVAFQWSLHFAAGQPMPQFPGLPSVMRYAKESFPPIAVAAIWNANNIATTAMMSHFFGDGQTALYGLNIQFFMLYVSTSDLGTRVIAPHILGPHGCARSFIGKLAAFMSLFLLALGVAIYAASQAYVAWCLPEGFSEASKHTGWLVAAGALRAVWVICSIYLWRFDRARYTVYSVCGMVAATIGLGVTLPSTCGPTSISIAMFIANLLATLIHVALAFRFRIDT